MVATEKISRRRFLEWGALAGGVFTLDQNPITKLRKTKPNPSIPPFNPDQLPNPELTPGIEITDHGVKVLVGKNGTRQTDEHQIRSFAMNALFKLTNQKMQKPEQSYQDLTQAVFDTSKADLEDSRPVMTPQGDKNYIIIPFGRLKQLHIVDNIIDAAKTFRVDQKNRAVRELSTKFLELKNRVTTDLTLQQVAQAYSECLNYQGNEDNLGVLAELFGTQDANQFWEILRTPEHEKMTAEFKILEPEYLAEILLQTYLKRDDNLTKKADNLINSLDPNIAQQVRVFLFNKMQDQINATSQPDPSVMVSFFERTPFEQNPAITFNALGELTQQTLLQYCNPYFFTQIVERTCETLTNPRKTQRDFNPDSEFDAESLIKNIAGNASPERIVDILQNIYLGNIPTPLTENGKSLWRYFFNQMDINHQTDKKTRVLNLLLANLTKDASINEIYAAMFFSEFTKEKDKDTFEVTEFQNLISEVINTFNSPELRAKFLQYLNKLTPDEVQRVLSEANKYDGSRFVQFIADSFTHEALQNSLMQNSKSLGNVYEGFQNFTEKHLIELYEKGFEATKENQETQVFLETVFTRNTELLGAMAVTGFSNLDKRQRSFLFNNLEGIDIRALSGEIAVAHIIYLNHPRLSNFLRAANKEVQDNFKFNLLADAEDLTLRAKLPDIFGRHQRNDLQIFLQYLLPSLCKGSLYLKADTIPVTPDGKFIADYFDLPQYAAFEVLKVSHAGIDVQFNPQDIAYREHSESANTATANAKKRVWDNPISEVLSKLRIIQGETNTTQDSLVEGVSLTIQLTPEELAKKILVPKNTPTQRTNYGVVLALSLNFTAPSVDISVQPSIELPPMRANTVSTDTVPIQLNYPKNATIRANHGYRLYIESYELAKNNEPAKLLLLNTREPLGDLLGPGVANSDIFFGALSASWLY